MTEPTLELPTIYPKTRANSLVPPILTPSRLKRKLSVGSSGDDEYEPGNIAATDSVDDDESSIQYEEDEKDDDEVYIYWKFKQKLEFWF